MNLGDYTFIRILNNIPDICTVNILVRADSEESREAIIQLIKKPWRNEDIPILFDQDISVQIDEANGQYIQGTSIIEGILTEVVKIKIIDPCTKEDIEKYSQQKRVLVTETAKMYKSATLPEIEAKGFVDWIANIINGKAEQDNILHQDSHCIILPNFSWDFQHRYSNSEASDLYILAICKDSKIRTIRDLTSAHLPMLHSIREASIKVASTYGVNSEFLRLYFHYIPSFYQLHLHVAHVKATSSQSGVSIGRAIFLDDVIQCLEIDSNWYAKCRMTMLLSTEHPLYKAFANMNKPEK